MISASGEPLCRQGGLDPLQIRYRPANILSGFCSKSDSYWDLCQLESTKRFVKVNKFIRQLHSGDNESAITCRFYLDSNANAEYIYIAYEFVIYLTNAISFSNAVSV